MKGTAWSTVRRNQDQEGIEVGERDLRYVKLYDEMVAAANGLVRDHTELTHSQTNTKLIAALHAKPQKYPTTSAKGLQGQFIT